MKIKKYQTLEQLLYLYWLRPETAIWRECDIISMKEFKFNSPSLDLGCGDGIFSFIRAGGKLRKSYDVFSQVSKINKYFKNEDIYNAFKKNHFDEILKKPYYKIDYGYDHKNNLLQKSQKLNFYDNLMIGNANKKLKFSNDQFNSVFTNILYWLQNPTLTLREIHRILAPEGRLCIMVPDNNFIKYSIYRNYYLPKKDKKFKFLKYIDRGRLEQNIKHSKSRREWENIFKKNNFNIVSHTRHLSKEIVSVWDIGFRPFFPMLLEMRNNVNPDKLPKLKEEWIKNLMHFAIPLIDIEKKSTDKDKTFNCYILEKK